MDSLSDRPGFASGNLYAGIGGRLC